MVKASLVIRTGGADPRRGKARASRLHQCPHCGQRMKSKKNLIAQLAAMSGVSPADMQTMSIPALEGLIEAWPREPFEGAVRPIRPTKLLPAKGGT